VGERRGRGDKHDMCLLADDNKNAKSCVQLAKCASQSRDRLDMLSIKQTSERFARHTNTRAYDVIKEIYQYNKMFTLLITKTIPALAAISTFRLNFV